MMAPVNMLSLDIEVVDMVDMAEGAARARSGASPTLAFSARGWDSQYAGSSEADAAVGISPIYSKIQTE